MRVNRRAFLQRVGQAGGYGAAFVAMQGLGLVEPQAAAAALPSDTPELRGTGKGTTVVVLGGGIAGLVAAYELRAQGFACTVLEARMRPGGRNWTVRGGDTVELLDGSKQACTWDTGNYQNVGPARLPSIHPNVLGYCRKLGVELQVEVNMSRSALLENDAANGAKPVTMREAVNDARGHVSELLAKSLDGHALDAEVSTTDRERMREFLGHYGPLDADGVYRGSDRAGYAKTPGAADDAGVVLEPLSMKTLVDGNFWQGMLFDEQFDMQATMFQPVGGMDRIPFAFAKSLGKVVQYGAAVTELRKSATGVRVGYMQNGVAKQVEAAYCICALPLTQLRKIPNDLSAPYTKVIAECSYAGAYKIAWESRRFWEQDYNIYGGLEFVSDGCSPVWFPSANLFAERGVLVSGYTDEVGTPFEKLTLAEKFAESRRSIERLHPGHGVELGKPLYVGWSKAAWNEGSWIQRYGPGQEREVSNFMNSGKSQAPGIAASQTTGTSKNPERAQTRTNPGYETLVQPDGPIFFAGDHVSHIVGWQEGAALSAIRAVGMIAARVKSA